MLRIRKDKKRCVRYLFSALFALLAFCFTSFIINQENSVYAVSDITYTFDGSSASYQFCYASVCDGYKYLILTPSSQNLASNFYFNLTYQSSAPNYSYFTTSISLSFLGGGVDNIYYLPYDSANRVKLDVINSSNWTSGYSVVVTLTDTLPSPDCPALPSGSITLSENGTYDVTSYAEAVVDVPAQTLPGDYDDEFNGVIIAIYTCGAIIIMIYFFYIIYGIIIKPTGGSK